MKETILGNHLRKVPSIAVGCMRLSEKSKDEMNHFIHSALEQGAYFFDHFSTAYQIFSFLSSNLG